MAFHWPFPQHPKISRAVLVAGWPPQTACFSTAAAAFGVENAQTAFMDRLSWGIFRLTKLSMYCMYSSLAFFELELVKSIWLRSFESSTNPRRTAGVNATALVLYFAIFCGHAKVGPTS